MSQIEEFENLIDKFNSSANVIRKHLASREANPTAGQGDNEPTDFPLASASEKVRDAHNAMLEAMAQIQRIFVDPIELNSQTTINFQNLSCLRWIVHFNIPAHVPLGAPVSYPMVAQAAKVPEQQLRQVTRMAMTNGIFRQPSLNMLAHTPLSAQFVTNPLYRDTAVFQTETTAAAAMKMTEMTWKYSGSEKVTETAHNIAMETDLPFFQYLSKNPKIAVGLQAGMKVLGGADKTHTKHLVEMFDWAGLGEAEIVDVGGSTGHVSIALAQAFPKLRFTVQDLPPVISKASSSSLPAEVEDRIRFVPHNFFQPQPSSSSQASIFLLRLVVQNHPKTAAQTILRNIASVMRPGALILLNNIILPDAGTLGLREEALARARSLTMMQTMNGAERDESEIRELVEGSGAGLSVLEVVREEKSALGLIVITKSPGVES